MINAISFLVEVNNIDNANALGSAEGKFPKIIIEDAIIA